MKNFRPMKPASIKESDLDNLKYPVIVQAKLDGIRCVILEGKAKSNSLKPIRNRFVRTTLERIFKDTKLPVIDGELLLKDSKATFQDIQSAFMSEEGEPNFVYVIFDVTDGNRFISYTTRMQYLDIIEVELEERCRSLPYKLFCHNKAGILETEKHYLKQGYEGIILRSPYAPYKFGRSTVKEGYLLKLKAFEDAEAKIIGYAPLEYNLNAAKENALGLTERCDKEEGKFVSSLLGSFRVKGLNGVFKDKEFSVGSGFTESQRRDFAENFEAKYLGKIIKYKYQKVGSTSDAPRCPIFLGFRDEDDI